MLRISNLFLESGIFANRVQVVDLLTCNIGPSMSMRTSQEIWRFLTLSNLVLTISFYLQFMSLSYRRDRDGHNHKHLERIWAYAFLQSANNARGS